MKARDAFQITAVGMHKIAEAERRAFRLKAEQSEQEAELLRRSGNLDRAKKFLEQETKWRAKMLQSDEAIYKDYKAQGRDSVRITDGILSSPLLALAALLAILSHFNKEVVSPSDYDLTTYKPPKRNW